MLNVRDLNTLMKLSWSYMKACKPELTEEDFQKIIEELPDGTVSEDELAEALSQIGKVDTEVLTAKLKEVLK